ncbi:MAG: oligoendopeptidase F [Brevundimonas sp.]|jgi:oligoendopeptidase F|uniref:M3 family oligoendopeptidase n=1 Tax=Brevundimonas sp. GW460-12-10-14-LB2 TaxID=1827469 RepID=UPI0007BCA943|nr:M3 family oligoendopeptidase [Brevundimonas sp. GW460-12-10-14-LB2]ANC53797.1 oligoendopeptidase F [Brevundimonas sp. GW460-12-10-14-LB2]MEA3472965.1 M3 family oligoendopeptidase [Pseudomonadota bacterium]
MNAPFKTPNTEAPLWDLTDLYSSRDDAKVSADLERARGLVEALNGLKGRLAADQDAQALGEALDRAIQLYEQASDVLGALGAYAFLSASTARDDATAQGFEADVREKITAIATPTVWLTLEINQIDDAALEAALIAHAGAARWRPWLRRVRAMKPHELSAELETFIAERGPITAQWPRLFDEQLAALRAKAGYEELTLAEALNRLSDAKPARRKAAAEGLSEALAARAPTLALVLNTVAADKAMEDRWRGFKRPADSRHLGNEVDGEAVDAMAEAVAAAYPRLSHRYYALKAKAMGKARLDHWDRNAPIETTAPRAFTWTQGREIVLDSFSDLGGDFADRAGGFFDKPWIDGRARPGKQSGAYAHPVTADRHPYVFLNWMGERRDVLTLAHELGHGVHQTLAADQGTLLADTPLTLAETASIFAEGLTFDRLLATAPKAEQRGLLAGRIEDGLNTVVRQIAFHRFETRFHDERLQGEVSQQRINQLWLEEMGASLGPSVKLNSGYEHWWAYVSHFVHSPFYVYAYAFGDLLVAALMEARRNDPAGFTPLYRELLAGGGSRTYVEALKPFGLDPRDPAFWSVGCQRLERLVDQFEALA